MIRLDRVTKYYPTPNGRHYVLRDVSMTVPLGRNIGVIGRNGAGKSTLLRLMAGADQPNSGRIQRIGRYSWPLALAGRGVQGTMTGRENVVFAGRIHGLTRAEIDTFVQRVEEFAELKEFFNMPVNTYSSGMRARLSFAIAMLFEFDCYFIDELNAVGDARFRKLTREYFREKQKTATFIQVSHDLNDLHRSCEAGILVDGGNATYFETVDEAIEAYRGIVGDAVEEIVDEEARDEESGRVVVPVAAPANRRARRRAEKARQRRRRKELAPVATTPASAEVPETVSAAAISESRGRAQRRRRRRKEADPGSPGIEQQAAGEAGSRPRRRRRLKGRHLPPASTPQIVLSPLRQIALKKQLNRQLRKRQTSTDSDNE